jgi:hypothetical protein
MVAKQFSPLTTIIPFLIRCRRSHAWIVEICFSTMYIQIGTVVKVDNGIKIKLHGRDSTRVQDRKRIVFLQIFTYKGLERRIEEHSNTSFWSGWRDFGTESVSPKNADVLQRVSLLGRHDQILLFCLYTLQIVQQYIIGTSDSWKNGELHPIWPSILAMLCTNFLDNSEFERSF